MDQFGVLVESIGLKSQGKSLPMADLKGKTTTGINDGFPRDIGINSSYNSTSFNGSFDDDLDGIFRSNSCGNNRKPQNYAAVNGYDDIFGGFTSNLKPSENSQGGSMFDFDSVFKGPSNNLGSHIDDDIFGLKNSGSAGKDDVFGSKVSPSKQSDSIDDLLGNFGGMRMKPNGSRRNSSKKDEIASRSDDLIPGFGGSSPSNNGSKSGTNPSWQSTGHSDKLFSTLAEDPFVMLERTLGSSKGVSGTSEINDYLDSIFSQTTQSSTRTSQTSTTEDFKFDTLFQNSSKVEQPSSVVTNSHDDFSYLFGMGDAPLSAEFQEIKGESKERRRARLNHYLTTKDRMAKVLNEKNQRDLQAQREQEERHRLAETLDDVIKRWAAGKEGNLRALLSSLQQVLWPECGWQPVSLTDLITSTSVKKVYYKATLCVHPDKVQQKGASLQQKYIAEKVFDLLKEAWNKLLNEELKKQ